MVHEDRIVHVEHVWNTAVSLTLMVTHDRVTDALAAIQWSAAFFAHVDEVFSTYRPETEASFYRNGLTWRGGHSREFRQIVAECESLRTMTRGAFDPWTVPGGFDPSGYVKGWAAGRASAHFAGAGFDRHLVNAGGDVSAVGDEVAGSGRGWPVGIVNPHAPAQIIEHVDLRDAAMATSGRHERGDHIIDPRTGRPAAGVDSATVVGPIAGWADAFASAAMVTGTESMEWFAALGPEWSLHLVVGDTVHTHGTAFDT